MDCSLVTRPSCSLEGSWFFQGSGWSSSSSSRRSSSSSSKYSLQLPPYSVVVPPRRPSEYKGSRLSK